MSVPGAAPSTKRKQAVKKGAAAEPSFDKKPAAVSTKEISPNTSGRPDKAAHDAALSEIDAEINSLKSRQDDLKAKISASDPKTSSVADERASLRNEMNALKESQAANKSSRGATLDELKRLQNKLQDKVKDLNTSKSKFPYKNAQEIDNQIKTLDKQIESGNLKIVDERKALNEISSLKKMRKTVDNFSTQQESIEADRAKIEEIKKTLDDPELKAANDKFNALKEQMDALNLKSDTAFKGRNKLFEERDGLRKLIDEQYAKRKELLGNFKAANDAYYTKITEERNKRIERQKAERQAYEDAKKSEINERLLEEASAPAFEREIEDCKTLIEYLNKGGGKVGANVKVEPLGLVANSEGTPKLPTLDIRQVDAAIPEGATALKKKGALDTEDYFMSGTSSKKSKKGGKRGGAPADKDENTVSTQSLQVPMSILSALLQMEIPTPLSQNDIPATVEALQTKQQYYKDNQDRVTKERIEAVKAKIARATEAVNGKSQNQINGKSDQAKRPAPAQRASAEADKIVPEAGSTVPLVAAAEVDETVPDREEPKTNNAEAEVVTNEERESVAGTEQTTTQA